MLESKFKSDVLERIRSIFEGCEILHNDSRARPGVPDTLILWEEHWAMLEFKKSPTAKKQPNQEYYVDFFDKMSFAAFIFPENEEEVIRELKEAFGRTRRNARLSKS